MFRLMGKEINAILGSQTIPIWTHALTTMLLRHPQLLTFAFRLDPDQDRQSLSGSKPVDTLIVFLKEFF